MRRSRDLARRWGHPAFASSRCWARARREPLFLAYGRGELPDFPSSPDLVIDVIPVDLVVSAMLVAAAHPPPLGEPRYAHISSSTRNPLSMRTVYEQARRYYSENPLPEQIRSFIKGGKIVSEIVEHAG